MLEDSVLVFLRNEAPVQFLLLLLLISNSGTIINQHLQGHSLHRIKSYLQFNVLKDFPHLGRFQLLSGDNDDVLEIA